MRHVISEEIAKARAKALRLKLSEMGIAIKHSQALEVIAALENEKGWSALNAKQNVAPPASPPSYALDREPVDPALAEYDYPYGVEYTYAPPGQPPKVFDVQPYPRVKDALREHDRVMLTTEQHHTTTRICMKGDRGGWVPLSEKQIKQAIEWETRQDKKAGK